MQRLAAALAAVAALAAAAPAVADDDQEKKPLVTILTAPEPQTQLMAMVLTMQAAQQGAAPHILLCGPAGDLALKEAPDSATAPQPPKGMSPQGLMKKIMGLPGAKVEVCAIYLPAKGADESVLLDGVTAAKPGPMAAAIMAEDARLLTF
jgi:predicted peroxiredoxin